MICGIDEAGRGPLAGPVCAAAVVLAPDFPKEILGDSKKLSAEKREAASTTIYKTALAWGMGWASHEEIDEINILQASMLAMRRAFLSLLENSTLQFRTLLQAESSLKLIVDGNSNPNIVYPPCEDFFYKGNFSCTPLVKADSQVHEVMAASIIAKTARDALMNALAKQYPQYGYEKHKGYPTKDHVAKIKKFGPSPIQRYSFKIEGMYLENKNNRK
ncbi:MAG: ribonuclease HII [Termitinemataceae bacterium]|nr:MAG: ribonuclease HII [Termitinemataceae bacterium]